MATAENPIRVLIADDHPLMRSGLIAVINQQADMRVIAEASDGEEALRAFKQHRPDVSVLDLRMPKIDGIGTTAAIKRLDPDAHIIVFSTAVGDVQIVKSFSAGAAAYLLKASLRSELTDTIRAVAAGSKKASNFVAKQIVEHSLIDDLSDREVDVLKCAAQGLSNKRIGDALGLTENTVKGHVARILQKLRANDRTHAVTVALQRGYFDLDQHHG